MPEFTIGDIHVDVIKKKIKNVHLSVLPPLGNVRISAPDHMDLETIRIFAISKLGWIKKQQQKLRSQDREAPREFIQRESHYYLGKRYLLQVNERNTPPNVVQHHDTLEMVIRPQSGPDKRHEVMADFYRQRLKEIVPECIKRWEQILNVNVQEFGIRKMKTRWGTCNAQAKRIWLNLELAKKPKECIEYIVVHEMMHLLERHHNKTFAALMNHHFPKWKFYKEELNRSPLAHEEWGR